MLVLIADDCDEGREVLRAFLEMKGHDVVEARDGGEALERARLERPGLILMDISMPVMDGLAAARELRKDTSTRHLPIIALSAHFGEGWKAEALAAGCDDYLPKPCDFDRLEASMGQVTRSRRDGSAGGCARRPVRGAPRHGTRAKPLVRRPGSSE